MSFLCDTNVLSELARPRPDPGVVRWAATVNTVFLSVVTVEEIQFGLAWKPHPLISDWFDRFFADRCTIVPVTAEIARHAGVMRGLLRGRGQTRTQADMLIAATALVHHLTLVTRSVRDFDGCNVLVVNPFEQPTG